MACGILPRVSNILALTMNEERADIEMSGQSYQRSQSMQECLPWLYMQVSLSKLGPFDMGSSGSSFRRSL